jgi:hypothetical protein
MPEKLFESRGLGSVSAKMPQETRLRIWVRTHPRRPPERGRVVFESAQAAAGPFIG